MARKTYEQKTGQNARGTGLIVNAIFGAGPKFHEDADGNLIREWQQADLLKWTYAQLSGVLMNRVSVTDSEMLGTVPPSAIKWSVNKGWLVARGNTGLYFITMKAAIELDLPVRFRGIHGGRKIPFAAEAPAKPKKA